VVKIQNTITDRQCRNKDWNQKLLDEAKVTLVGAGPLANFVATNLVCLNVGNIRIIDNSFYNDNKNEFILYRDKNKGKKTKLLEKTLKGMNPFIKINGIDSKVLDGFASNSDVIVDLTNDLYSKFNSIEYSKENKIPLILASTDSSKAVVSLYNPKTNGKLDDIFFKLENQEQGNITSAFATGFIVEEVRKLLQGKDPKLKKERENLLQKNINYFLNEDNRFVENGKVIDLNGYDFSDKKVLIVGAGALGNFYGINAALLGIGNIDVIDMDYIEETNLNRQPLYSFNYPTYVDKKKVDVIVDELKKITLKSEIRGIYGKLFEPLDKNERERNVRPIDENFLDKEGYNLIIGCLDNVNSRARTNQYAVDRGIPYIDGGTGPFGGRVAMYIPNKTACLDCQLGLYKRMTKEVVRDSCISDNHEPSVVMPNDIIAALMAGETALFCSKNYENPPKNIINLDSYATNRVGIAKTNVSPSENCKCYGDKNG